MPLVRFEVRNEYGLGDPELVRVGACREDEPKALLDAVAVAGLVGVLRQLGDLAEFAADVFHDLHEQIIMTAARGRKIMTRVQNIETALPSLEKAVKGQTSHIHFAYLAGCDWHSNLQNEQSHLLSSDLPRFMMDSYEECHDPPRLYLLDKFDNAGAGSCLKRYSDPSYFKKAWDTLQEDNDGILRKEKKAQIAKRKGSQLRNSSIHHELSLSMLRDGDQHLNSSNQPSSSRHYVSRSPDRRSFSDRSVVDVQSNPEVVSASSVGLKTGAKLVDQAFDKQPSHMSNVNGRDKSLLGSKEQHLSSVNGHGKSLVDAKAQHPLTQASSPVLHANISGNAYNGDSEDETLVEKSNCRSSSVTWDEKEEIVTGPRVISYDDKIVDKVVDTRTIRDNSIEDSSADCMMEQNVVLHKTEKCLLSESALKNFAEVNSEIDNYVDALNSMESETESECHTKAEAKPESDIAEAQSTTLFEKTQHTQSEWGKCTFLKHVDSPGAETCDSFLSSVHDPSHLSGTRESIALKEELLKEEFSSKVDFMSADVQMVPNNGLSGDGLAAAQKTIDGNTIDDNHLSSAGKYVNHSENNIGSNDLIEAAESGEETHLNDSPASMASPKVSFANGCAETSDDVRYNSSISITAHEILETNAEVTSSKNDAEGGGCDVRPQCSISETGSTSVSGSLKTSFANGCVKASDEVQYSSSTSAPAHEILETNEQATYNKNEIEGGGYDAHSQSSVSGMGSISVCEPQDNLSLEPDTLTNMSSYGVPTSKLWTNAGLFGLMPSKPADFSNSNGQGDVLSGSKESACHLDDGVDGQLCHSAVSKLELLNGPGRNMLRHSNLPSDEMPRLKYSTDHDQLDYTTKNAGSLNHMESQIKAETNSDSIPARTCLARQSDTPFFPSQYAASNMLEGNSIFDGTRSISASFSTIAQRFLANTLQRKGCLTYADQSATSRTMNSYAIRSEEPSNFGKCSTMLSDNTLTGATSYHYSDRSSPPLEFMKISFHPMNVHEISNPQAEFSTGEHRVNVDNLVLPTSGLPSEPSLPLPESGSESDDDDTFGRSYNFSSYDDLSPRCYSNSETWEEQDGVCIEEQELYNDLGSFYSSLLTNGHIGLERIDIPTSTTTGVCEVNAKDQVATFESHSAADLPTFDSVILQNSQPNVSVQPSASNLSNSWEDHRDMPPPPPLPPMQWRMMKKSTVPDSAMNTTEVDKSHIVPNLQRPLASVAELQEPNARKPSTSHSSRPARTENGVQATKGNEKSRMVNFDNMDTNERDDLLHQIRSKTFNLRNTGLRRTDLRRTASAKPTSAASQPTTDSNVSAILEKASAIRQAFVGSDDGAEDDSWSDT